jgi:hypothetical protein
MLDKYRYEVCSYTCAEKAITVHKTGHALAELEINTKRFWNRW